ncbi:MAG: hypothetical protein ACYDBW_07550 [Sulfuricaulis sp.]
MTSYRLFKPFLIVVAGLSLGLALPAWADAKMEIKTATEHASFAVNAKTTAQTHMHLHHVINCLVGTNGEDFDATAGNPCQGMGGGALKDSAGSQGTESLLNQSLRLAKIGIEIGDHHSAQAVALATRNLLRLAENNDAQHRK